MLRHQLIIRGIRKKYIQLRYDLVFLYIGISTEFSIC